MSFNCILRIRVLNHCYLAIIILPGGKLIHINIYIYISDALRLYRADVIFAYVFCSDRTRCLL